MTSEPCERSIRQVRQHLADVINDAIRGRVTYITSRGRVVAAIIPPPEISDAGETPAPEAAITEEAG
jgi:antitoxin (DNA-binding transcriptional repressor) of toxin-antitoxin stability system